MIDIPKIYTIIYNKKTKKIVKSTKITKGGLVLVAQVVVIESSCIGNKI